MMYAHSIGFPGQFRNFVDQIHFMSIQFRRFGSCTTDLSFDFIFQAFDFALTPIKSKFVSFKFQVCKTVIQFSEEWWCDCAIYCYSSIQIHFGAFYLTRWAFKFAYFIAPVDFINHNSVFLLVIVFMFFSANACLSLILYWIIFLHKFNSYSINFEITSH